MSAPPQDPLPETQGPVLQEGTTKPQVWVIPPNETQPQVQTIDVIRAENNDRHGNNPTQLAQAQAYKRIPTMTRKCLDHHAPGWGCVYFAVILPQVSPGVFQEPTAEQAQLVAIKRLKKSVVDDYLARGRNENPYKEIQRMQTLGDNVHVLGCLEALVDSDNDFLYIIMPYCEQKSLAEWIPWNQGGVSEHQAKQVFSQILENIIYLHDRGICHRDLSPDNCMIYNGRVVLIDLAMSFQIPVPVPGPGPVLTTPMGGFGKPAFLPPEVFMNLPFDAKSCDLWSSLVVLFNLLTGEIMFRLPIPQDLNFRYFILAGGISSTPQNERTVEILLDLADDDNNEDRQELWNKAQKCLGLSPEALELFQGVLQVTPHIRWTEHQVETCRWMTSTP